MQIYRFTKLARRRIGCSLALARECAFPNVCHEGQPPGTPDAVRSKG